MIGESSRSAPAPRDSASTRARESATVAPYLRGAGLDLSALPGGEGAPHGGPAIDNGYTLRHLAEPESLDYVYSRDLVNATKFHRILLQEWLGACKVGGFVVIEMRSNPLLSFEQLLVEAAAVARDRAAVAHQQAVAGGGILVLRKTRGTLAAGDSIDAWTLGIITNGRRNDWVERQIESIRALEIPRLEIVVCGTYFDRREAGFRYIEFKERDDRGWITRKKNLICEASHHQNIVLVHDKMIFDPGWFAGMKRFGNYFDVLGCRILDTEGERAGDWVTFGNRWDRLAKTAELDYADWDEHGFLIGSLYILKRSVWQAVPWDETLFWNEKEDIRLARDLWDRGFVTRFNPYSQVTMLHRRFGRLPRHAFDPQRLGPRRDAGLYYWYMAAGRAVKKYILRR